MLTPAAVLARGPWAPEDVTATWREDVYVPDQAASEEADRRIEELRRRGSPSYDGQAGRLVTHHVTPEGKLHLELQPMRWALRLIPGFGCGSLSALCAVRDSDGNWLAGRRASWVATWAGRWALGAAGAVDVGESPAHTLVRELQEEWSVEPTKLQVEALVRTPNNTLMLVGQAWLAPDTTVTPDHEHDEYAWWPPRLKDWPEESSFELTDLGLLLTDGQG